MTTTKIHICDKCGDETKNVNYPAVWTKVKFTSTMHKYPNSKTEISYDLCEDCANGVVASVIRDKSL